MGGGSQNIATCDTCMHSCTGTCGSSCTSLCSGTCSGFCNTTCEESNVTQSPQYNSTISQVSLSELFQTINVYRRYGYILYLIAGLYYNGSSARIEYYDGCNFATRVHQHSYSADPYVNATIYCNTYNTQLPTASSKAAIILRLDGLNHSEVYAPGYWCIVNPTDTDYYWDYDIYLKSFAYQFAYWARDIFPMIKSGNARTDGNTQYPIFFQYMQIYSSFERTPSNYTYPNGIPEWDHLTPRNEGRLSVSYYYPAGNSGVGTSYDSSELIYHKTLGGFSLPYLTQSMGTESSRPYLSAFTADMGESYKNFQSYDSYNNGNNSAENFTIKQLRINSGGTWETPNSVKIETGGTWKSLEP